MERRSEQEGVPAQLADLRFTQDMDILGSIEESFAVPDRLRSGGRIVIAGEDVNREFRVGPKEINHTGDQRLVHLIVLEEITGDEKRIRLVLPSQRQRALERGQAGLTEARRQVTELGETSALLPVRRVDQSKHHAKPALMPDQDDRILAGCAKTFRQHRPHRILRPVRQEEPTITLRSETRPTSKPAGTILLGDELIGLGKIRHLHRLRIPFDPAAGANRDVGQQHRLGEWAGVVEI